jgi:hypothetical protein
MMLTDLAVDLLELPLLELVAAQAPATPEVDCAWLVKHLTTSLTDTK